jgi:hypothetical protein
MLDLQRVINLKKHYVLFSAIVFLSENISCFNFFLYFYGNKNSYL